jgi:hypothetical protein
MTDKKITAVAGAQAPADRGARLAADRDAFTS